MILKVSFLFMNTFTDLFFWVRDNYLCVCCLQEEIRHQVEEKERMRREEKMRKMREEAEEEAKLRALQNNEQQHSQTVREKVRQKEVTMQAFLMWQCLWDHIQQTGAHFPTVNWNLRKKLWLDHSFVVEANFVQMRETLIIVHNDTLLPLLTFFVFFLQRVHRSIR